MEPSIQLAAILLAAAVFILILELFIPSAGMLFVLAVLCMVGSILVAFWTSPSVGWSFLGGILLLLPVLAWGGFQIWQRSPIGRRMFLEDPVAALNEEGRVLLEDNQTADEKSDLLNKTGRTLTSLRPAGITEIDGQRVDTVSEGVMIDRGETVRVVQVQGNRVVVRRVDPERPDDISLLESLEE